MVREFKDVVDIVDGLADTKAKITFMAHSLTGMMDRLLEDGLPCNEIILGMRMIFNGIECQTRAMSDLPVVAREDNVKDIEEAESAILGLWLKIVFMSHSVTEMMKHLESDGLPGEEIIHGMYMIFSEIVEQIDDIAPALEENPRLREVVTQRVSPGKCPKHEKCPRSDSKQPGRPNSRKAA